MVGGWVDGLVSSSSGSNGWFVPYGQESSKKYLIFTSVALFLLIFFFFTTLNFSNITYCFVF